ncbi:hypothetical protein Pmani_021616 [Petrolisthes manimaculis]|uniref:Uncharacterized protein n=1 Tax=Petrolisthes manimaculis TaxID=1843537 RepID=A0AAE1PFF9_9EUCA|nr:hypothetical protein Pmani_021616 [Petrolisthes manimaculis]
MGKRSAAATDCTALEAHLQSSTQTEADAVDTVPVVASTVVIRLPRIREVASGMWCRLFKKMCLALW